MNKKMLTVAVTTALTLPITAHADIKFYGQLGAEIASVEYANGDENLIQAELSKKDYGLKFEEATSDDMDRQTLTLDRFGNILNDGPNMMGFDFDYDKNPGKTLTPYARYRTTFHTTANDGLGPGLEAWAGLHNDTFSIRYGKLRSAYRDAKGLIDPWIYTSMQARGSGGGMSAGRYNEVFWNWNQERHTRFVKKDTLTGKVGIQPGRSIQTYGLVHNSDVNSMGELAVKFGPISSRIQITGDDAADRQGGNFELKYTSSSLTAWLIGSYLDQGENQIAPGGAKWNNDKFENWKVGAQYKVMPTLKLALQYEDAELGAFDNNPDGGKYIIGSFDYRIQNVSIAGWVAGYLSDIKDQYKLIDVNNEVLEEDVLSWSLGARYHFSKRSSIFVGYRQTDSDNDYRDENVFSGGILHKF